MSAAVIAKFCQPRGLGRIAGECIQRQPAGLRHNTLLFFAKKLEGIDHCTLADHGARIVHGLPTRRRANPVPGIAYLVIMNIRQIIRCVEI